MNRRDLLESLEATPELPDDIEQCSPGDAFLAGHAAASFTVFGWLRRQNPTPRQLAEQIANDLLSKWTLGHVRQCGDSYYVESDQQAIIDRIENILKGEK